MSLSLLCSGKKIEDCLRLFSRAYPKGRVRFAPMPRMDSAFSKKAASSLRLITLLTCVSGGYEVVDCGESLGLGEAADFEADGSGVVCVW